MTPLGTLRLRLLVPVLAAGVLSGCTGLAYDRQAMLGQIADTVILPNHRTLADEASRLDDAAGAFAAQPTEEALAAVRTQWLATERAWKHVELYEFPGLLLIHNAIEKRPARTEFIEQFIEAASDSALSNVNAAAIETLGSTSKGLGAVEYLVFESEDHRQPVLESFADPARGAYLTALTANLEAKTRELYRFWTPGGENYAQTFRENDSEGPDIHGSISLLTNLMIQTYETVMQNRLGLPSGITTNGGPDPEAVESPLSGRSLDLMIATLEGIRWTFDAGFDNYVDHLDSRPEGERLSDRIRSQFDDVFDALRQIDEPLAAAVLDDRADVQAAYEGMRPLLVSLKTDMAAQLGITVTFSDSDGD